MQKGWESWGCFLKRDNRRLDQMTSSGPFPTWPLLWFCVIPYRIFTIANFHNCFWIPNMPIKAAQPSHIWKCQHRRPVRRVWWLSDVLFFKRASKAAASFPVHADDGLSASWGINYVSFELTESSRLYVGEKKRAEGISWMAETSCVSTDTNLIFINSKKGK